MGSGHPKALKQVQYLTNPPHFRVQEWTRDRNRALAGQVLTAKLLLAMDAGPGNARSRSRLAGAACGRARPYKIEPIQPIQNFNGILYQDLAVPQPGRLQSRSLAPPRSGGAASAPPSRSISAGGAGAEDREERGLRGRQGTGVRCHRRPCSSKPPGVSGAEALEGLLPPPPAALSAGPNGAGQA